MNLTDKIILVAVFATALNLTATCGAQVQNSGCEECQKGVVTSDVLVATEYLREFPSARMQTQIRNQACPKCDCDHCELKIESSNAKQTCYKVNQKEVCIPPVTLPWMKNCPPKKAKVRVVNVLSKKTLECPKCKYTWEVHEPPIVRSPTRAGSSGISDNGSGSDEDVMKSTETSPNFDVPKTSTPKPPSGNWIKLNSVPDPPVESNQ